VLKDEHARSSESLKNGEDSIYADLYSGVDIDNVDGDNNITSGKDDQTRWCDKNLDGRISNDEKRDVNRIWDFSESGYPAIGCYRNSMRQKWLGFQRFLAALTLIGQF